MNPRRAYTLTLSLLLLVEGVLGLFSPVVFGILATNILHAVIHIALGIVGIWAANTGRFRGYLLFVGFLLLTVGALWFVSGVQDLIIRLLNVNHAVAIMNVVVGTVSLLMGSVATPFNTRRPK